MHFKGVKSMSNVQYELWNPILTKNTIFRQQNYNDKLSCKNRETWETFTISCNAQFYDWIQQKNGFIT